MEKGFLVSSELPLDRVASTGRLGRLKTRARLLFGVQVAVLLAVLLSLTPQRYLNFFNRVDDGVQAFITENHAVGTVKWFKCRDAGDDPLAECGYIIAPLDYFNPDAGSAYIALARYPATVHPRKGSILFNPGGPGGSGRDFVAIAGSRLQSLLGEEFDIIGFDPRGIGATLPGTKCFQHASYADFKRNTILSRSYDIPSNASRAEARLLLVQQQRDADALLKTQFEICKKTMGDQLKYMGTSTVVRDIDFITQVLEGEDALINFYGASYGTILGQYLVNMLPNRVGRIAIDGVADAVAWSSQPYYKWYKEWLSSTSDTYQIFLRRCAEVGPSGCALAKTTGERPGDIEDRIEQFIDSLYHQPLEVPSATLPGILTAGRARMYLLEALEVPSGWKTYAQGLSEAMQGNGTAVLNSAVFALGTDVERSAVSCNDNLPFSPPAPEVVVDEVLDVFHNVSRLVFGVITSEADAGCQYWPVTPPERFQGPWNHTLRNPMLVVSNTADPVTPIRSGRLVEKLMGNSSRLVIQDSPGHCSLALPSACTIKILRSYFADGILPPPGTICSTDYPPFPEPHLADFAGGERHETFDQSLLSRLLHRARRGLPLSDLVSSSGHPHFHSRTTGPHLRVIGGAE